MFEKIIEHYGKGMVDYALPVAVKTNYQTQLIGYWISEFSITQNGKPEIVLEIILYGSDHLTGRNANKVKLEKGETCLVFFYTKEKRRNMSNMPQYCYIKILEIHPLKKFVKLHHMISSTPISIK